MSESFRDPDGRVIFLGNQILRIVRPQTDRGTIEFVRSEQFARLIEEGLFVPTKFLGVASLENASLNEQLDSATAFLFRNDEGALLFEHERVFFPSYAHEWPLEMLYAAGLLTLDLAERLLPAGFGLKDATPYNVLFRGPRPVFVDLLSFERREPLDPTWRAYGQFVRTFVRPLLVNTRLGLGTREIFTVHRDGLNAAAVNRLLGVGQKLQPTALRLITLPSLLGRLKAATSAALYQPGLVSSREKATFILERQFSSFRKTLNKVSTRRLHQSVWSDYTHGSHHSPQYFADKREFVENAISAEPPKAVLDIGCNRGDFSAIAARNGARVVAIDSDDELVGALWLRANAEQLDILPLVVDWTRPTPALGWRNRESFSFLERASGTFDCILMLAVIHHMMVTERIPLDEIFSLAAEITTDRLLIEFVPPADPKFKLVTRGNDHLYEFLTKEHFETVCRKYFQIEQAQKMADSERWLYVMRRQPVA